MPNDCQPTLLSDKEKEQAIGSLTKMLLAGRIDHDSHEQRVAAVLAAADTTHLRAAVSGLPLVVKEPLQQPIQEAAKPVLSRKQTWFKKWLQPILLCIVLLGVITFTSTVHRSTQGTWDNLPASQRPSTRLIEDSSISSLLSWKVADDATWIQQGKQHPEWVATYLKEYDDVVEVPPGSSLTKQIKAMTAHMRQDVYAAKAVFVMMLTLAAGLLIALAVGGIMVFRRREETPAIVEETDEDMLGLSAAEATAPTAVSSTALSQPSN